MSRNARSALRVPLLAILVVPLLVLTPTPAVAAVSGIEIGTVGGAASVNGQIAEPLSGAVTVTGRTTSSTPAPQPRPLVADAGDSPFVSAGDRTVLLGAAYGGTAPYTFAWTSQHGTLAGADASSAELDTTGLAPGTYPVSLRVTDSAGGTASDTVQVVVYEAPTLLHEVRADGTPGVSGVGQLEFPFTVEPGTARVDAKLSWTNEVNDYDLYLRDPDGDVAASSTNGNSLDPDEPFAPTEEATSVTGPAPGTWTLRVDRWVTVTDTVTVHVSGAVDPRPVVRAGGPYAFSPVTPQELAGTVSGGKEPVTAAWDLDGDGVFESEGASVTANLPEGRHLVTLKATDANGLERRETTSVLVADPEVLATQTTPLTVIGVADTGINPYHLEFSARTYPDPDVLALTKNFTRHPAEYISGYPKDAEALNITLDQGYFPEQDEQIWFENTTIKPNEMYWFPGTKIIGAVDPGAPVGATSGEDTHPILDDNGHGSGSASVSAGNRYGYCPTCLLVVSEGLNETVVAGLPWVDISSNSFGYVGGLPFGPLVQAQGATKTAAERGQTTLFAAGNGIGNAFDVPINTWHSDKTGPDWNITVGAIRRDNQRAVVGDGIPVHLSSWGDGNLPSACGTGTVGQCAFGGTSAATPYTAGVFGTVLSQVRAAVGDGAAGQRPGQAVAVGVPRNDSVYLNDGTLTRGELREAVLKTALPLGQGSAAAPFVYPLTAPYTDANVLFEGYGAATPNSGERAIDVLLGRASLPDRAFEDDFFANDRAIRDRFWGGYDRDGDGDEDFEGLSPATAAELGVSLDALGTPEAALAMLGKVAAARAPEAQSTLAPMGENTIDYYLHRRVADVPDAQGCSASTTADTARNEQYMDRENSAGDLEPCFENRATSVAAAYRPVGIFASADTLTEPLPAGSTVNVELYMAGETPSVIRPTGVLVATDRELGAGDAAALPVVGSGPDGAGCAALEDACWTKYSFTFDTTRHAFTGEQLTFQVRLLGARSWAFGFEGAHASKVQIEPAPLPASGLEFGVKIDSPADGAGVSEDEPVTVGGSYAFPDPGDDPTGAGDHPVTRRVEVSLDDASFATPVEAVLDEGTGTWHTSLGALTPGAHTVYARARIDTTTSDVVARAFTVTRDVTVEWQVVDRTAAPDPGAWRSADGVENWTFTFDTASYGAGARSILARVVDDGQEVARDIVHVTFR